MNIKGIRKLLVALMLLIFITSKLTITIASDSVSNTATELTLDAALQKALMDNNNLNILRYTWQMWHYQTLDLNNQLSDLQQNSPANAEYFPVDRGLFEAQIPNYDLLSGEEKLEADRLIDTQILINQTLNLLLQAQYAQDAATWNAQIADQREQINEIIYQLEVNQDKNKLQEVEMNSGIKLLITKQFVQILSLKEEMIYLEKELEYSEKEIKKAEIYKELGIGSQEDVLQKKEGYRLKSSEWDNLILIYDKSLLELSLELDIPKNQEIQLQAVDIGAIEQPIIPSSYSELVYRQYRLLLAEEDLVLAEHQLSEVSSGNLNLKKQYEYNVKIAEEQIEKLKDQLESQIAELYSLWQQAYADYSNTISSYEYQRSLEAFLQTKYRLGLIAKHDLDNYYLQQALLLKQLTMAKLNYFLAKERVGYLLEGYIE